MPRCILIACASLTPGRSGRNATVHRLVHGVVHMRTRGGLRKVKVGPCFAKVTLQADRESGCQLASMVPPSPLDRNLAALVAAIRPPEGRDGGPAIDLASLLSEDVRAAGGRGEIDILLVAPGLQEAETGNTQLGLLRMVTAGSLAAAADSLTTRRSQAAAAAVIQLAGSNPGSSRACKRDPQAEGWDRFDPGQYVEANYAASKPADLWLCAELVRTWESIRSRVGGELEAIDVGTGPNLYTILAALPHVRRLHAYEFSSANRSYLADQRADLSSVWQRWLGTLWSGPAPDLEAVQEELRLKLHVVDGSLYGISAEIADVATMFFCAECITADLGTFYLGCRRLACAVRPGGALIGAFMLGSDGYETAGVRYPSVPITEREVRIAFEPYFDLATVAHVPGGADVRDGYEGMLFVFGWRREPPPLMDGTTQP